MATTPVEFRAPTGLTLTLELYAYGSDTIGNTGGDSATEATNRKGLYSASVTEALAGWYTAHVKSGSTVIAVYDVFMVDDTSVHRCTDRPQDQAQETVASVTGAVGSVTGAVGSVTGNVGGIAGTITTLDALDTAQDTQHSTTQSAISALNDPTAAAIADAVWLETLADHSGTAGSTAEALNAAGAAGDPWTTALPGAYGAGSAGNIIGNLNDPTAAAIADAVLDEAMAGHVTAGSLGKHIADILVDTAEIGAAGAGLTAIPWNAAWDAEVQSECTDALNAYDPPTNAEMAAEFTAIKGATWSAVTDTLEAIRDRGDSAWITATGFSTHSAADVRTEIDSNSTQLAAIVADTNELQTDWANGGRLDLLVDAILEDTGTTLPAAIPSAATIATTVLTTQMTESYAAAGAAPTLTQAVCWLYQDVQEAAVSGTTKTVKRLDQTTAAGTVTLDDANTPTSLTRAT